MLQDLDILEDWTTIRKAMATLGPHRVKTEPSGKLEKHLYSTRSEEGRLYYNGEWYGRGQTICIDRKDECPTSGWCYTNISQASSTGRGGAPSYTLPALPICFEHRVITSCIVALP
ncbi:UNVERIFIED_CONTAM: Breast cancer metastasis-suppressor 1-like protein [Gekko kuhli]